MASIADIFRNLTRPLSTRSLAELVALSALCHLLAFLAINFTAWLFPRDFTPITASVEIVTEQQLQQRLQASLSRSKTSPQKKVKLENTKAPEKKEEQEKKEKKELPKETPKRAASKVEQPKPPDSTDKNSDSSDPIEDILSSLEEDSASEDEQKPEASFEESLEEALAETPSDESLEDTSEPLLLSSEQILTASELAAFRKHIFACWSPPIGAPSLENLVVDLDLTLDQNAYVIEVRVIDKSRMSRDPFFRSAAEAALRTLSDGACSPLKLPLSKYPLWERTILRFDPRRLFGL